MTHFGTRRQPFTTSAGLRLRATFDAGRLTSDGGLLDQEELNAREGATVQQALQAAASRTNLIERLFLRALSASAALECPSPREWLQALRPIAPPRHRAPNHVSAGTFIALDPYVFIQLDRSRFTNLHR